MPNVNVWLFASGTIAPGRQHHWFWDVPPWYYNPALRRVRSFSAVPFVSAFDWDSHALPLPPVPPWPNFEQRIAVTQVFHLLKATPPPEPSSQCDRNKSHGPNPCHLPPLHVRDRQLIGADGCGVIKGKLGSNWAPSAAFAATPICRVDLVHIFVYDWNE